MNTYYSEYVATLSYEQMFKMRAEWSASRAEGTLQDGLLSRLTKECVEAKGHDITMFGRMESARDMIMAVTSRLSDEFEAALPVLETSKRMVLGRLAYTETEEDYLEEPDLAAGDDDEVAHNRALADYLKYLRDRQPKAAPAP